MGVIEEEVAHQEMGEASSQEVKMITEQETEVVTSQEVGIAEEVAIATDEQEVVMHEVIAGGEQGVGYEEMVVDTGVQEFIEEQVRGQTLVRRILI